MKIGTALLALLAVTSSSGCSRRYFIRPTELNHAQSRSDAPIPALSNDGEPTFILASRIGRTEGLDPATGLYSVRARDWRNSLRITGWVATSIGFLMTSIALPGLLNRDDPDRDEMASLIVGLEGLVHLLGGAAFLAVGYISTGPEVDGPAPGP